MTDVKIIDPLCMICCYLDIASWGKCEAFPRGIPDEILSGQFDHSRPWPKSKEYPSGDNRIQFKPVG